MTSLLDTLIRQVEEAERPTPGKNLNPDQIRAIFISHEPPDVIAKTYGVTRDMVLTIWKQKKYRRSTGGLEKVIKRVFLGEEMFITRYPEGPDCLME